MALEKDLIVEIGDKNEIYFFEKLLQQFIDPDFVKLDLGKFESWLRSRAEVLRKESNSFLEELMRP